MPTASNQRDPRRLFEVSCSLIGHPVTQWHREAAALGVSRQRIHRAMMRIMLRALSGLTRGSAGVSGRGPQSVAVTPSSISPPNSCEDVEEELGRLPKRNR